MTGFEPASRLGQPQGTNLNVVTMFNGTDLPEASYDGQMIYRPDRQTLQVYRAATDAFEDVIGGAAGLLTFVGPNAPVAQNIGDLWFESDNHNQVYRWDGSTWVVLDDQRIQDALDAADQAIAAAADAQATADGAVVTFFQTAAPSSGMSVGDLWFDTDDNNKLYRYDGSAWVLARDQGIVSAASAAAAAQSTANSKITTFYASSTPTALATGDLWVNTAVGNRLSRWDGTSWVIVQDSAIATAQSAANTAQTTANSKTKTFSQSTTPTATTTGDIWIDTGNGNVQKRWNGTSWVNVQDAAIGTAQTTATNAGTAASNAQTSANTAQSTANSKVKTFTASSAPTASTTGDLWIDTGHGNRLYRWDGTAWGLVQDAAIGTAQSTANSALTAATSDGAAPASSPDAVVTAGIGQLFVNWLPVTNRDLVTYDVHLSTSNGFTPDATTKVTSTKGLAFTVKTDAAAMALVYGATYYARIIASDADGAAAAGAQGSATVLQVTSGDIAAGSITAVTLAANSVTSDKIAAASITADKIASSTLNANLAILGTLRTASSGRNITLSSLNGLQVFDANNNLIGQIPTDVLQSVQFQMALIANNITALGPVSLRSNNNEIAQSAVQYLRNTTTAPITAPSATITYPETTLSQPSPNIAGGTFNARGTWVNSSRYLLTTAKATDGNWYAYAWHTGTGAASTPVQLTGAAFANSGSTYPQVVETGGTCTIGANQYVAVLESGGDGNYYWKVYVYNASLVYQSQFTVQTLPYYEYYNTGTRRMAMTTNGTNIYCLRSKPATNVRFNLMPNPSFEGGQGTTNYTYTGNGDNNWVASFNSNLAPGGPYALKMHYNGHTGGIPSVAQVYTPWAPVSASSSYYGAFYYLINRSGTETVYPYLTLYVRYINSGGGVISDQTIGNISTNAAQSVNSRIAFAFNTPAGCAYVQIYMNLNTGSRSGAINSSDFVFDGFQIEGGGTDQGYFDANFGDDSYTHYQWSGTQNLSTSVRVVSDHTVEMAIYNTSGVQQSATTLTSGGSNVVYLGNYGIENLYVGNADFGFASWTLQSFSGVQVYNDSGAYQTDWSFYATNGTLAWDSTANSFYSLYPPDSVNSNGPNVRLYKYSSNTWLNSVSSTWYATSTWKALLAASTVSNKALTSNVATLTTSAAHGLAVGDTVIVTGVDATFNGTWTVASVPNTVSFTYADTAANVASTAATGSAAKQYETTQTTGAANSFTMLKRASLALVAPSLPGGVADRVGFYLGRTDGTRTTQWLQGTSVPSAVTLTVGNVVFSGLNPPATNNFPQGTAARFLSDAVDASGNAKIDFRGDGKFALGDRLYPMQLGLVAGTQVMNVGTSLANGSSNNVIGAVTVTAANVPANTVAVWARYEVNAYSSANQQVAWTAQISLDSGTTWTTFDSTNRHNGGVAAINLSSNLLGYYPCSNATPVQFRLTANIGGGGQPVVVGSVGLSLMWVRN